jgi:hypothetical protein
MSDATITEVSLSPIPAKTLLTVRSSTGRSVLIDLNTSEGKRRFAKLCLHAGLPELDSIQMLLHRPFLDPTT